jgi:hypothetical protein
LVAANDVFIPEDFRIITGIDCVDTISADKLSECPVAKFVVSLISYPLVAQCLKAINSDGTLHIGNKLLSLDEKLFHELNHVREFLIHIHGVLHQSLSLNHTWNIYGYHILYVAQHVLVSSVLASEWCKNANMNPQDLIREAHVCTQIYGHHSLSDLDQKISFDFGPQSTIANRFSNSDMEFHCMTGLMPLNGKIFWDRINETNYGYTKGTSKPRVAHQVLIPEDSDPIPTHQALTSKDSAPIPAYQVLTPKDLDSILIFSAPTGRTKHRGLNGIFRFLYEVVFPAEQAMEF